ncbi:MAG TPA: hypothetical protein VJY31_18005 [Buttiauxella sp.]|nr:hypothetical protein [Buttiauxella sp.]
MKHNEPEAIAENYQQACDMLRSGYVKSVRLNWDINTDDFFKIASDWCDAGAKIKRDDNIFIISIKGIPIPRIN